MFKKYEKVLRFEKPECEGVLNGNVYLFEKIDGANVSIWKDIDTGKLCAASHNHQIMNGEDEIVDHFNGFIDYILEIGMKQRFDEYFADFPFDILYGEWLIPHTVQYPQERYKQMYIFDVYNTRDNKFFHYDVYSPFLLEKGFVHAPLLTKLYKPTIEDVMQYVGQTKLGGTQGEGIVLKNYDFINKYGRNVYAKIVCEKFLETKSIPKTCNNEIEKSIADEYITQARVDKIIHKVKFDINHGENVQIEDIPKVLQLTYNDVITEDMWEIVKKKKNPIINFKTLRSCIENVTRQYFFVRLNNQIQYD